MDEYDIIVDSTGEIYRVKRDRVHTRTWHCWLTKEQEEAARREIERVLGKGGKNGERKNINITQKGDSRDT